MFGVQVHEMVVNGGHCVNAGGVCENVVCVCCVQMCKL